LVPEAFVHQADRQGLKSSTNAVERLLASHTCPRRTHHRARRHGHRQWHAHRPCG
jgi:hypothetical protein